MSTGDEWAAVCLFYAAYHDVKAALIDDPIFDSHDACQTRSAQLFPDDRHASAHKARRGGHSLGVNDVVSILYKRASGTYERLHQMSIDVRYGGGLAAGAREALPGVDAKFTDLVASGALTSGVDPT